MTILNKYVDPIEGETKEENAKRQRAYDKACRLWQNDRKRAARGLLPIGHPKPQRRTF